MASKNIDIKCYQTLKKFFIERKDEVFYGRQIEVIHEKYFYHWVTNRAIRLLHKDGFIERWQVTDGANNIMLCRHKSLRYFKNLEKSLVEFVSEIRAASMHVGHHLENLMVAGFATHGYEILGREQNSFLNKNWTETGHDLDIIMTKDNVNYGVEIKNTLSYMDKVELDIKTRMCEHLGLLPVFVNRFAPYSWINELHNEHKGFALILKYQIHPTSHKDLVDRMLEKGFYAGCPKWIEDGTIQRFTNNFHLKHVI